MLWRLYYAGQTFSSDDGSWQDAPVKGVQALVTPDSVVGRVVMTNDFYAWYPGEEYPWSMDAWGLMDYLLTVGAMTETCRLTDLPFVALQAHGVKLGRSLSREAFQAVHARATADPDFPIKSARLRRERE